MIACSGVRNVLQTPNWQICTWFKDWHKEMHEQQKDCIAKAIHREMHMAAGFLLILITFCVNMDKYEATGRVRVNSEWLELPVSSKIYWILFEGTQVSACEPTSENLGEVFIKFWKVKGYIHIIFKDYRHCSPQIILHVWILHDDISIDIAKKSISLFTDVEYFAWGCAFNHHNVHIWAGENLHSMRLHAA